LRFRKISPARRVFRGADDDDPICEAILAVAGEKVRRVMLEGNQNSVVVTRRSGCNMR